MSIRLHNIAKHFGRTQALEPIDLDIHEGELVGLLGPSGALASCFRTTRCSAI